MGPMVLLLGCCCWLQVAKGRGRTKGNAEPCEGVMRREGGRYSCCGSLAEPRSKGYRCHESR